MRFCYNSTNQNQSSFQPQQHHNQTATEIIFSSLLSRHAHTSHLPPMSQPSKKQKTSLQKRVLLDDAKKFIEVWLEGNECTNFFNKVIKRDDIEFMPTKAQINPEAYEGEDAEEDGDESVDVDTPVYWSMIRHMSDDNHNWKDLRRALNNSQQFAYHTAHGSCFFGFIGDSGNAEGYAGEPAFQKLVADFHGE